MGRSARTGEVFTRAMPEESEDKRAARVFLYNLAASAPKLGHAVALAGWQPEAEVALMRWYLGWPGSKTWFVDWARDRDTRPRVLAALDRIRRAWPTANVVRGDINKVMDEIPLVGFANLDFMSYMDRESAQPCLRAIIDRLAIGGVVGYTWYRGREVDAPHRSAWDVLEAARDIPDKKAQRWAGVTRLIHRWGREAGAKLEICGALEYQHAHSPMAVIAFRRKG